MKKIFLILLLFTTFLFSRDIITITYPFQEYFIKKIAYEKVYIKTVFLEDDDLSKIKDKSFNNLAFTKYYFTQNLPIEKKIIDILKSKNNEIKVINLNKNIPKLKTENGLDNPYIWMDPILCREYAKNIYEQLVRMQEYNKEFFKINYEKFLKELDETYLYLKERIDKAEVYGFLAFNEKLDYFAKRFRLDVYHKENRVINLNEVSSFLEFSHEEHLRHIVLDLGNNYKIAQSYANYIDGKIIEVDVFERNWKISIYALVRRLTTL